MFTLESPHRGDSNEYTQFTIFQYEKEKHPKFSQICSYGILSKGLKNEFERAVVNEPSVFEPLKFYCIWKGDGAGGGGRGQGLEYWDGGTLLADWKLTNP